VHVTRDANGNDPGGGGVEGFVWSITFTGPSLTSALDGTGGRTAGLVAPSVNPGDQALLVPNGRHLTNTTHSTIEVLEVRAGIAPNNYRAVIASAAEFTASGQSPSLNVSRKVTGTAYYARVSAASDVGFGAFAPLTNLARGPSRSWAPPSPPTGPT